MKIAILGGSFDPPHIWHFWLAQQTLEKKKEIDRVWLLPDYQNAFRSIKASVSDRLAMLGFLENDRIKISTLAVEEKKITYTIDIVSKLIKDKQNHYLWLVGSDVVGGFSRWRNYQKLSALIQFLVFPRLDYPLKNLPVGFTLLDRDLCMSNISSTMIRERIKKGLTISHLVPEGVESYIRENKLYR